MGKTAVSGVGRGDDSATQAFLACVEHHRLSRRHGALRLVEPHLHLIAVQGHHAGLILLAVTGLGGAAKFPGGRLAGHPSRRFGGKSLGEQPFVFAALGHVEHIPGDILADHVPGLAAGILTAADPQSVALTQGVIHHTLMFADQMAFRAAHFARPGRDVLGQKLTEIAFADKADPGRIFLRMGWQCGVARHLSHL